MKLALSLDRVINYRIYSVIRTFVLKYRSHCARSAYKQEDLLNSSTYLNIIYEKAALYSIITPPLAYNKVNLYYIYFIKSSNSSVYEIDSDISRLVKSPYSTL